MKPANNLSDLAKNYPKVYQWLVHAFIKNGFQYYHSPTDALSLASLHRLDLDPNLPLFVRTTSSMRSKDYVQFTHGVMDVSNCISDKSFEIVSKLMTELNQKIYNPYNIHLSLPSAKKRYPKAFKFLMNTLSSHGFTYLHTLSEAKKEIVSKSTDLSAFISDSNSAIFSTVANGDRNYLQLTSSGRWNLALCNSYVRPTALTIIQMFFKLVHESAKTAKSSVPSNSSQGSVRYLGLGTKVYVGSQYNAKTPDMFIPVITLNRGRATTEIISLYRFETDGFQSNIPLFSQSQVKAIESGHLVGQSIVWIPYDNDFYLHFTHYVDKLSLKAFNGQMNHYLVVLDSFYDKNDQIRFNLLVRNEHGSHYSFKIVNRPLSKVLEDSDKLSLTDKEIKTKGYQLFASTYALYIERIPVNEHTISNLLSYANTMSERRRYVAVNVAKSGSDLQNAKFNVLLLSNVYNICDGYTNVPLPDLLYDPKYHLSKAQAIAVKQSDTFDRKKGDVIIPLDLYITDRIKKVVENSQND